MLTPRWQGAPPPDAPTSVVERCGVDLTRIDPASAAGRFRLSAYLWPDHPERRALTDAAIAVATAPVNRTDALDWLADCLTTVPGSLHLVYHTVAWQCFPAAAQTRARRFWLLPVRARRPGRRWHGSEWRPTRLVGEPS